MDNQTDHSTPRRLTRRSSERIVAGVAGGLGDYTGVDPVFFRIGFIVLALAGGSGLVLYALGWLFIPEENQPAPVGLTLVERLRGRRWLAIMALGIVAIFFTDWIQDGNQTNWNLLSATALIAIGFVLLRDEPRSEGATNPTPSRELAGREPVTDMPMRRSKKPRSPLGFMTLGTAFVAVAIAVLLSMAGVVTLDLGQYVALALTVLGAGLIVGAWWGRARLLVVLATLLVPVMVLASMIDVPLKGTISGDYLTPIRHIDNEYELLAGSLTLDLSRYRFGNEPTEIDISFVAANVTVYVPEGVHVTVTGAVDLGNSDLFGESSQGRNLALNGTFERKGLTEGELVLNIDGGFGSMDTTWARWVDHEKRRQMRIKERKERRERAEVKDRGRANDRKRDRD